MSGTVSGAAMIAPPIEMRRNAARQNNTVPAVLHRVDEDIAVALLDTQRVCHGSRLGRPLKARRETVIPSALSPSRARVARLETTSSRLRKCLASAVPEMARATWVGTFGHPR